MHSCGFYFSFIFNATLKFAFTFLFKVSIYISCLQRLHTKLGISKDVNTTEPSPTRTGDTSSQRFSIPKFATDLLHCKITPCFERKGQ